MDPEVKLSCAQVEVFIWWRDIGLLDDALGELLQQHFSQCADCPGKNGHFDPRG
jgi:hypothetical protein